MKARDVMTQQVISVEQDTNVLPAAQLMLKNKISGLPVVDANGIVVGIVTEGDFLRRAEIGTQRHRARWLEFLVGPGRLATEYVRACGRKVNEVMTPSPHTITEETPLEDIVHLMERYRIKRLPVVRDCRLVGIVSRANLLHALGTTARELKASTGSDAVIRQQILAEFGRQPWASAGQVNVIVRDGVVELWGTLMSDRTREAFIVAAENVPGVKSVHDHLVWVEPTLGMFHLESEEDRAVYAARNGNPAAHS